MALGSVIKDFRAAMTVMETRNAHNKVNQSKQNLVSMERFQVMNDTKNTNINLSNYVLTSNLHIAT